MNFRRLFSEKKKKKLVYSIGLSQVDLSRPSSGGGYRTTYNTCLTLSMRHRKKHRLAKKSAVANIAERQYQKFNCKD